MTLNQAAKKRIIFCDFDGTITINDNIIAIIRHFNPPGWESIVERIVSQKMAIRDGVGQLFHLIPASMQHEVVDYGITNARIRDGFAELLTYCKEEDVEFYVTSGGINFFVYPILESFGIPQDHIYCNGSDFSGETIEITWPHVCDDKCSNDCGMCKTTIMRRFPKEEYEQILIGDSVTDFEGAKLADVVFSRSILTEKCKELGIAHHEFENFHDIISELKKERTL